MSEKSKYQVINVTTGAGGGGGGDEGNTSNPKPVPVSGGGGAGGVGVSFSEKVEVAELKVHREPGGYMPLKRGGSWHLPEGNKKLIQQLSWTVNDHYEIPLGQGIWDYSDTCLEEHQEISAQVSHAVSENLALPSALQYFGTTGAAAAAAAAASSSSSSSAHDQNQGATSASTSGGGGGSNKLSTPLNPVVICNWHLKPDLRIYSGAEHSSKIVGVTGNVVRTASNHYYLLAGRDPKIKEIMDAIDPAAFSDADPLNAPSVNFLLYAERIAFGSAKDPTLHLLTALSAAEQSLGDANMVGPSFETIRHILAGLGVFDQIEKAPQTEEAEA